MNPQEKVLAYAHKHNHNGMTDQEFAGKMIKEGVVIERTPTKMIVARIRREGNEIIITETTKVDTIKIENGKVVDVKTETTIEIERISL